MIRHYLQSSGCTDRDVFLVFPNSFFLVMCDDIPVFVVIPIPVGAG